MSIIVLYIIHISLTIIKCNVLKCFHNSKITGAFRPKVVHCDGWSIATSRLGHCDFAVGALRLGLGHSGRGAFRQRGIPTIILIITYSVQTVSLSKSARETCSWPSSTPTPGNP